MIGQRQIEIIMEHKSPSPVSHTLIPGAPAGSYLRTSPVPTSSPPTRPCIRYRASHSIPQHFISLPEHGISVSKQSATLISSCKNGIVRAEERNAESRRRTKILCSQEMERYNITTSPYIVHPGKNKSAREMDKDNTEALQGSRVLFVQPIVLQICLEKS